MSSTHLTKNQPYSQVWAYTDMDHGSFDKINRVDTDRLVNKEELYGSVLSPNKTFMNRYEPTDVTTARSILNQLITIDPAVVNSSLIDFGCGKGRVLLVAEKMGFTKLIGVEFSSYLCKVCANNIKKTNSSAQIYCADAAEFELTGDIRTFYFFNPFEQCVLEKVLSNVRSYLQTKPYDGYIIYVYPLKFGRLDPKSYELLYEDYEAVNPFHIYRVVV